MGDLAVAVPAVDLAPAPHRAGDCLLALLAGHPGNVLHPARIEAGLRRGRRLVLPRSLLPLPALRVVGERRLGRRRGQPRGAGPAVARRLPRLVQLAAHCHWLSEALRLQARKHHKWMPLSTVV